MSFKKSGTLLFIHLLTWYKRHSNNKLSSLCDFWLFTSNLIQSSQEDSKTIIMQNFGGQQGVCENGDLCIFRHGVSVNTPEGARFSKAPIIKGPGKYDIKASVV